MPRPASLRNRYNVLPVVALSLALPILASCAPATTAVAQQTSAPAAEDAEQRLAASPRHGEWADVDAGDAGTVAAWVSYPERSDNAPVVVVIHEIFGMSDWVRAVADAFAAEGFIAIAPDLLSGKGPDGGGSETIDEPRRAVSALDGEEVRRRLDAVAAYASALPAANGKFGVVGYCWGGSTTFRYATLQPRAGAAVVFYGSSPDADALRNLEVPVLGLYGGDDARVNATIDPARQLLQETGACYEVEVYEGAGHGFLRAQNHEERGEANTAAAERAWTRAVAFFRDALEG